MPVGASKSKGAVRSGVVGVKQHKASEGIGVSQPQLAVPDAIGLGGASAW